MPATIGLNPLFWPVGSENMGGYKNRLVFYPTDYVSAVPLLPKIDAVADIKDLATATGTFEMKDATLKPIALYATDKTVKMSAENQGETDGQSFNISGEWFFPGHSDEAAAFARKVNNTPGYLLVESNEGNQYIVGQPGLPCNIKPAFEGGQARADRRGTKFTFQADSFVPYIRLESPIDIDTLFNQ